MAAKRRGSVKVSVQPEKDWLEAIATLCFSSRSVRRRVANGAKSSRGAGAYSSCHNHASASLREEPARLASHRSSHR